MVGGLGCNSSCDELFAEQGDHGDVVILPMTGDAYSQLTLKLRDAFVHFAAVFVDLKFLLKVPRRESNSRKIIGTSIELDKAMYANTRSW